MAEGSAPDAEARWEEATQEIFELLAGDELDRARSAAALRIDAVAAENSEAGSALAALLADEFFYAGSPEAWEEAERLYRRSLSLLEGLDGSEVETVAEAHARLASLLYYLGRWDEAEAEDRQAQALRETHYGLDSEEAAGGRIELAKVLWQQGRFAEAESLFRRSLATLDQQGTTALVTLGDGLQGLAEVIRSQGDYDEAEPLFRRAIEELFRSTSEDAGGVTATALSNLSILLKDVGRYRESDELLSRAEEIWTQDPNRFAWALNTVVINRAELLRFQGRLDEAAPLYVEAVRSTRELLGDENPALVWRLNQHGVFLSLIGEDERAQASFREGLSILERTLSEAHPLLAQASDDFAKFLCSRELGTESETLFDRALKIREQALGPEHPDTAQTLVHWARCLLDRSPEATRPRALANRALQILVAGGPHPAERADALAILAELEHREGSLESAVRQMRGAVEVVEAMRVETGGSDSARANSFELWSRYFESLVAWELERGRIDEALEVSERRRARVFLEQLAAGRIDLRRSIPEDKLAALEADDEKARAQLAELQGQILFLLQRSDLRGGERNQRLAHLQAELTTASRLVDQASTRIRDASPLWQRLMADSGRPATTAQLQRDLVPEGHLMLIYDVTAEGSFLFLVPPPPAATEVFALQLDEATPLTRRNLEQLIGGTPQQLGVLASLQGTRGLIKVGGAVGRSAAESTRLLERLWEILIPPAIRSRVLGAEQVTVIPDGGLQRLPFSALVVAPPSPTGAITYWLDAGPPLSYAASATVLANLEQRPELTDWTPVLTVADPDFSGSEKVTREHVAIDPSASPPAGSLEVRRNFLRTDGRLPRLPGTRQEAEGIGRFVSPQDLELLMGADAREATVRRYLDQRPRILHFATHGLVDESPGSLLAALALTPAPPSPGATSLEDSGPSGEDDGYLQLFEIYELPLDAELVVLSACDSHVGYQIEGEGVFALSRGFLAAGSRRVLASQWPVDDASTAALMTAFYRELALDEGSTPRQAAAEALRAAQLEVRNQERWASPYHWAPFVLSGAR